MPESPKLAFAANRRIGYRALKMLIDEGIRPAALLIPRGKKADKWCDRMAELVSGGAVLRGIGFREPNGISQLRQLQLDYILSVHFPYVLTPDVFNLPRVGTLNLHPSYLPYNRGWHTPSWAIVDGTPYGATLHWVDGGLDTGDIALQRRVEVREDDTAHALYQRVLDEELALLRDAIPLLASGRLPRTPQMVAGTAYCKKDLQKTMCLDLAEVTSMGQLLRRLRSLTTNCWDEAAYFEDGGVQYRIRVDIRPQKGDSAA